MTDNSQNFENMTTAEFEHRLPDLFAKGDGRVSDDPDLQRFLAQNPTCAALVRDLEYIAETAKHLLHPAEETPSDAVWSNIQSKLKIAASSEEPE
ncbi:MAG: hypothetical protein NVSMB3_07310 [Acidobacteriaceae bacterium]